MVQTRTFRISTRRNCRWRVLSCVTRVDPFLQPKCAWIGAARGKGRTSAETLDAETPYIYSRMPWIGYENCTSDGRFLAGHDQMAAIKRAADNFQEAFGFRA